VWNWTQNKFLLLKGDFDTQNMPESFATEEKTWICDWGYQRLYTFSTYRQQIIGWLILCSAPWQPNSGSHRYAHRSPLIVISQWKNLTLWHIPRSIGLYNKISFFSYVITFLITLADTSTAEPSLESLQLGLRVCVGGGTFWKFTFNSQHSICKMFDTLIKLSNIFRQMPIVG